MKLKNFFFMTVLVISVISLNSCKKDNNKSTTTDTSAEAQTQSTDNEMYSSETDAATNDANAAVDANGGSVNDARTTGINTFPFALPCDATVTVDTTGSTRTITLTYSGANCSGTRTRSGSIIISFASGFKWATAGAQLTITFSNFKVTRVKDGKSVVINGQRLLTNTSGGLLRNLATLGTVVHTVSDVDMSVTFDNGTQRKWQNSSVRTFTYDNGVVLTVTGSGSGVNRFGHNFTTTITEPLVVKQSCDFRYTSGQIQYIGTLVTTTTTFGLDSTGAAVSNCPATLYYKVVWTGAQGTSLTYIGSY